jgi:hypothetical protein
MADTLLEGRGPGVTAITAILNLNHQPFDLVHHKYPHYNRPIPPGLFRYPRGTTAPINWGAAANGLIQLGGAGTLWQHNVGDWSVRHKAGGHPVSDGDGDIIYTRRPSGPGEHYLILGVNGHKVVTLQSYTPGEAFLENLREDVLNVLNIFKPADYITLAENAGAVRLFLDGFKAANDAGHLEGLDKRDVEALSRIDYGTFQAKLQQLSPEDRQAIERGNPTEQLVRFVKWLFVGMGIAIMGTAVAIAVVVALVAKIAMLWGPPGWVASAVLLGAAVAILATGALLTVLYLLLAWMLHWLQGHTFNRLREAAL